MPRCRDVLKFACACAIVCHRLPGPSACNAWAELLSCTGRPCEGPTKLTRPVHSVSTMSTDRTKKGPRPNPIFAGPVERASSQPHASSAHGGWEPRSLSEPLGASRSLQAVPSLLRRNGPLAALLVGKAVIPGCGGLIRTCTSVDHLWTRGFDNHQLAAGGAAWWRDLCGGVVRGLPAFKRLKQNRRCLSLLVCHCQTVPCSLPPCGRSDCRVTEWPMPVKEKK